MKKILIFLTFFLATIFVFPQNTHAITYDLIAPSGTLTRGQNVNFTVKVDTEGSSYASTQIGMTYDTTVLEYVSITPSDTFSSVTTSNQGDGQLILTGSSANGYSGSGTYAVVTFKIIASQSGSTTICALFNPTAPTVAPTALPRSGSIAETGKGLIGGAIMLLAAVVGFVLFRLI